MRLPSTRDFCGFLGAATLTGCSLIYDLSPDQCGNDADCGSFGQNYACVEGICQGFVRAECEEASECESFAFEPTACIEKEPGNPGSKSCQVLRTAECPLLLPTGGSEDGEMWRQVLSARNPIILGGFGFITPTGSTFTATYNLAFTELQGKTEGVPGEGGARRPILAVICRNNKATPDSDEDLGETLSLGMDHLVEDLMVPGLIAAMPSDRLTSLFSRVRDSQVNRNVMFMAPAEADRTIVEADDDDLIWNLLPTAPVLAVPYQPLLERTIDYLIRTARVASDAEIKVALVYADDVPLLEELTEAVETLLVFNEKSLAENEAAGNAVRIRVVSAIENNTADLSDEIDGIIQFAPDIVLALSADELFSAIIPEVERRWEAEAPAGQQLPYYLLSPYHTQTPSLTLGFLNAHRGLDPIHKRMAGVQYAAAPDAYSHINAEYEARFLELFPDHARSGYENYHDAPWWLIYSIAAGVEPGDSSFDGRNLVDGMTRLQDGEPFEIGPDDLDDAFGDLGQSINNTIQLNTTLGPPTFDLSGTRQSAGSVWCIDTAAVYRMDVLQIDDSSGAPVLVDSHGGFAQCNPDF